MSLFVHSRLGHFLMNETQSEGDPAGGATPPASEPAAPPAQPPADPAQVPQSPQQPAEKPPAAPESYQFTYPEGYTPDDAALGEITGVFKELGLTQEQAQKLVEYDAKRMSSATSPEAQQAAAIEHRNAQVAQWEGEIKADKELGGANLDASIQIAQKALASYGSPELSAMLKQSGLGSHPEIVRFFHKVGKELSEGSLHRTTTEVPAERSLADRMYPNYSKS